MFWVAFLFSNFFFFFVFYFQHQIYKHYIILITHINSALLYYNIYTILICNRTLLFSCLKVEDPLFEQAQRGGRRTDKFRKFFPTSKFKFVSFFYGL